MFLLLLIAAIVVANILLVKAIKKIRTPPALVSEEQSAKITEQTAAIEVTKDQLRRDFELLKASGRRW